MAFSGRRRASDSSLTLVGAAAGCSNQLVRKTPATVARLCSGQLFDVSVQHQLPLVQLLTEPFQAVFPQQAY